MGDAAVEVRELVKRYGSRTAVAGLSMTVQRGEVLALLGPNGAGKTTTIEVCEGYRAPDSGSVRVFGADPIADARAVRPRVGLMPQDGVGGYTAARAVELLELFAGFAARPHDPRRAARTGRAGRLGPDAGQAAVRRAAAAAVARAGARRSSRTCLPGRAHRGYGPAGPAGDVGAAGELKAAGLTVVLTTHYLEEAERLADRVVVIDAGAIVAEGTPAELMRRGPDGPIVFCTVPGLDTAGLAADLPPGFSVREIAAGRYEVDGPADPVTLAAITAWCARRERAHHRGVGQPPQPRRRLPGPDRPGDPGMTGRGRWHESDAVDWAPAPGAARNGRMLAAQARIELRLLLRNGEQVGLTLVIPLLLLVFFNLPILYSLGGRRIDFVVPSIVALSVMSAAFTGLAIGTGFERKYGVLKRLGGTALPRRTLLMGKTLAVLGLEVIQLVLIVALGFALGWHPHGDPLLAVLLVLVGTVAFGALGLLLAGALRAEVTLAAANLVWLILLFCGGIAVPLSKYPHGVARCCDCCRRRRCPTVCTRSCSTATGSRSGAFITLLVWAAVAVPAATRWFRWE